MSELAIQTRDTRRVWARPGSSHDRLIRTLNRVLPVAIGGLVAVLVVAPLAKRNEISFVLAKDKVEQENRGFFHFGKSEPIVARISGEFRGFGKGRNYTLDNGQVWAQIDTATLVGAKLESPEVRITPSVTGNSWYLAVKGYNTRAKVERVK